MKRLRFLCQILFQSPPPCFLMNFPSFYSHYPTPRARLLGFSCHPLTLLVPFIPRSAKEITKASFMDQEDLLGQSFQFILQHREGISACSRGRRPTMQNIESRLEAGSVGAEIMGSFLHGDGVQVLLHQLSR